MKQARVDQTVASHAGRAQAFTCSQLKHGDGTLLKLLTERPLREGLIIEGVVEFFETYRMAQIWNQTITDPRTLNIELDQMMSDFPKAVDQITNFLGSRSKATNSGEALFSKAVIDQEEKIKEDALVFNMGSDSSILTSLYTSIYNSEAYKHGTGGEDKAVARAEVDKLICKQTPLRALYDPIFELLGWNGCLHRRRTLLPRR
jgi:hypothetical protein